MTLFFDEAPSTDQMKALRDGGSFAFYQQYRSSLRSEQLAAFYPSDGGDPTGDVCGNGRTLVTAGADPAFVADGGITGGGYTFDGRRQKAEDYYSPRQ